MKYVLDTNTCVRLLNGRSKAIADRFHNTDEADIAVSSIVKAEMFFGSRRSQHIERNLATQREFFERFTSLPFDDNAAEVYGILRAKLETAGTPIGPNDLMIAAIALARNLILVTSNVREFSRIEGLQIENWDAE